MDEPLTFNPLPKDAVQYQQAIAQCLAEVDCLRDLMRRDQIEIDRSLGRTYALLAEIKATLGPAKRVTA